MVNNPKFKKYTQALVGMLIAANLILSIFLIVRMKKIAKVGYVDMDTINTAVFIDITNKNQEVLKNKVAVLSEKEEKYKKLKNDFERKKKRGKSADNQKTMRILEDLKAEMEEGVKAYYEELGERVNKDFLVKLKEIEKALNTVRKRNRYDLVFNTPVKVCLDGHPGMPPIMKKIASVGENKADLTKQVLDELGLKEGNEVSE